MAQLDWTSILNIGVTKIDEQHKQLISLSNSLIQAMTIGKGNEVLTTLFEELKAYTLYHFEDEEKYMASMNYPQLENHKVIHTKLIEQVDTFRNELLAGEVTPNQALDFVNDWIIEHIMDVDAQIGEFARNQ